MHVAAAPICSGLDTRVLELREQFEEFLSKWIVIKARFDRKDKAAARRAMQRVSAEASELFAGEFVLLADRIVETVGRERLPAEPHDPPELSKSDYHGGKLSWVFFRTRNTLECGKLVLLWAAMAARPPVYHRPVGFRPLVKEWAAGIIVCTKETPGLWRTLHQPMLWARGAFENLLRQFSPDVSARRVVLAGRHEPAHVLGIAKSPLTATRYDVVKALLKAGATGLTGTGLNKLSDHSDSRKILKRLAASDPDWKAVIHFPGSGGRGYRLVQPN